MARTVNLPSAATRKTATSHLFVVDVSASQGAGSLARTKEDLAAELCAVLALAAIRNKDKVGLLLFASKPERYVRPAGGTTHVLRVVREVLWAQPETRGTDIGAALEYSPASRSGAAVFLVSDFLTGDFTRQLRAAARRHDILVRPRTDRRGAAQRRHHPPRRAETGAPVDVDTVPRASRHHAAHVRELDDERKHIFGALGIDEIAVTVGEDYVPALLRFFKRRGVAVA
jgi:hypothetical protein